MKRASHHAQVKSAGKLAPTQLFALAFGLFLGLMLLKFGNPVILDHKVIAPASFSDAWNDFWPPHWAKWLLLPLTVWAVFLVFKEKPRWPASPMLWLLPLIWLGWQFLSAGQTTDAALTAATLWQFFGVLACYFTGALLFNDRKRLNWLLAGLLTAFVICLIQAIHQRLFEFPQSRQMLIEGERAGWTNTPPEVFLELKSNHAIITTNGVDVVNPIFLSKFEKARVYGTLVYPNALAGMILLLFPVALTLALQSTKPMKRPIRLIAIALLCFLGSASFLWTGSKLGWLVALVLGGAWLLHLKNWSKQMKWLAVALVLLVGLGVFAARFQNYFKAGATSTTARLDYWRAAVQTAAEHPMLGSGPGTFQHSYARLKAPESEMTRLTHNDYLEQFSDAGIFAGLAYCGWIGLALWTVGRRVWKSSNAAAFAIFLGLLGWFLQGWGEFGLYIPAAAWIAFTFLGCGLAQTANEIDKKARSV